MQENAALAISNPNDPLAVALGSAALVLSLVAIIVAVWTSNRENNRALRQRMDDLLLQMAMALDNGNVQQGVFIVPQAIRLLKAIPKLVNAVDYATTANTLHLVNNWPEGNEYYEMAINKAREESDFTRAVITRGYACALLKQHDHEKARRMFQNALEILPNDKDSYKNINAITHQLWCKYELRYGSPSIAKDHYLEAKRIYETIQDKYMEKDGLLTLEQIRTADIKGDTWEPAIP